MISLRKLLKIFLPLIITSLFFLNFSPVKAQSFSLSITPPILEAMIMPGKTITKVYKLTNQGPDTQVYTTIVPFEPKDSLGNVNLKLDIKDLQKQKELLNWFSWQNTDINLPGGFKLKSGQTQELVLKVKIPENAKEKDYYLSLLFQNRPIDLIGNSGAQATGVIASNILLTVSKDGKPPKNGEIIEFKNLNGFKLFNFPFKVYDSFDNIPFLLIVENTSKTLFQPYGSVKIESPLGKQTEFLEILPQNILAFSKRKLMQKGTEEDPLKPLSWQINGFNTGMYKAKASLVIADTSQKLEAETRFFIFPWKLSLGFAVTLIFLAVIYKKLNQAD
jgi:hypothetical protein